MRGEESDIRLWRKYGIDPATWREGNWEFCSKRHFRGGRKGTRWVRKPTSGMGEYMGDRGNRRLGGRLVGSRKSDVFYVREARGKERGAGGGGGPDRGIFD